MIKVPDNDVPCIKMKVTLRAYWLLKLTPGYACVSGSCYICGPDHDCFSLFCLLTFSTNWADEPDLFSLVNVNRHTCHMGSHSSQLSDSLGDGL